LFDVVADRSDGVDAATVRGGSSGGHADLVE
jgi:hypothetical protein